MDGSVVEAQELTDVAINGTDVYIQDPATGQKDQWIKGTLDGSKITIDKQFMGTWDYFNLNIWAMPTTFTEGYDSAYMQPAREYEYQPQLVMDYDADTRTLTCPEGWGFCVNGREDGTFPMSNYDGAELSPFDDGAKVPAIPYYNDSYSFSAYNEQWGYGFFSAYIPQTDVNGGILNPDKLFYRIYRDSDTPWALSTAEYAHVPDSCEGMTDFPWSFSDNQDIFAGTGYTTWYFYSAINDSLGLQSVYKSDGVENVSPIAWLYPQADGTYITGIQQTIVPLAPKNATQWYSLDGRQLAAPMGKGIFIRRTTDANGNAKVEKLRIK